jgi:hypothetical protein
VREASRGPFFRFGGGFFEFHLRALRRMSGTSAWFQDPLALGLCAPESRHDFELSAVQISGLPGYDRPLTHTVTLRLARSFILARWRHAISSSMSDLADIMSASAARCLNHMIRSESLPPAGAERSLTLRQVQPSNYRHSKNIPIGALVEELCGVVERKPHKRARRVMTKIHEASLSFSPTPFASGLAAAEPASGSSAEAPNLCNSRFIYLRKR